jgi:hypothetical protein
MHSTSDKGLKPPACPGRGGRGGHSNMVMPRFDAGSSKQASLSDTQGARLPNTSTRQKLSLEATYDASEEEDDEEMEEMIMDHPCLQTPEPEVLKATGVSGPSTNRAQKETLEEMKHYIMKLATPNKNSVEMIMTFVNQMMQHDKNMIVKPFNTTEDTDDEDDIIWSDDLPDSTADWFPRYFKQVPDKKYKTSVALLFRVETIYNHVKWRNEMAEQLRESNIYIGIHKLDSAETQIIGFLANKHPEETHINRYEAFLQSQLPKGTPKFALERIHPRTANGFEEIVRTEVLAIRVGKNDVTSVDKALMRLLPPQPEGEYYDSYLGMSEDTKRKTYQHQNWYWQNIKTISVTGFNNIDRPFDIGMNRLWSF